MTLAAGTHLGAYEVLAPLGAGGMGEVYRAKDTRLDREVAIKVLPETTTRDPERTARFEREAKLLASLNHTNIAVVHGFDEVNGIRFLVMEFVEGESLAQRLKRGALSVDDAIHLAQQIAEALEAAHDKGVIHRDLKPANVMVRPDLSVKVLDFGLAKGMAEETDSSTAADSPTITANYTRPGTILGTAAYMSPEQARGRTVDKRTDVWSFGVILFECLTGVSPFQGDTPSDSMGAIMHKEPDWSLLPSGIPPTVRLLLRRCLTKERRRRLQAIGDARVELEERQDTDERLGIGPSRGDSGRRALAWLPWALCAVLAMVVAGMLVRNRSGPTRPVDPEARRSAITLPEGNRINWRGTGDSWSKVGFSQLLALSRDGRRLVMTVQEGRDTSLHVKDDRDYAPSRVTGTDGARGPFFSPDAQWVGFLQENTLYKVRLPGGTRQPICDVNSTAFDATWLDDGTIVYSTDHGLRQVASDGGVPRELTALDFDNGMWGHHFPNGIPYTQLIIFTATTDTGQHAAVLDGNDGTWKIIKQHATGARYVGGGYLMFARSGELIASRFDPSDLTMVGQESPVVRNVHTVGGLGGAVVHAFATSDTGVLAYTPKVEDPEPDALVWVDHQGHEEEIVRGQGEWMHQRLSPTGEHILFNSASANGMLDLFIYDRQREQINRLTRQGNTYDGEWSPNGRTVCFNALDTHGRSVFMKPADFSGPARKIIDGLDARPHLSQWTDDGSTLVFFDRSSKGGLWTTSSDGDAKLSELVNTPLGEAWARISPDGRLIAYVGWESDRRDVYVQEYPDLAARVRVSREGGGEPRWARDARTLYFREAGRIYQASIALDPKLDVTNLVTLPINDIYDAAASGHQHYDLSMDGKKFLMVKHGRRFYPLRVHVIENWPAAFSEDPRS